jgi:hypothetical protein
MTKKQGVSQGVTGERQLGSNLGPYSAEHPLKSHYKTQNRAKRFNKLDNQNCFGTRGSEVQILSPRPIFFKRFCGSTLGDRRGARMFDLTASERPAVHGDWLGVLPAARCYVTNPTTQREGLGPNKSQLGDSV